MLPLQIPLVLDGAILPGGSLKLLIPDDAADLQRLYEQCNDYAEHHLSPTTTKGTSFSSYAAPSVSLVIEKPGKREHPRKRQSVALG